VKQTNGPIAITVKSLLTLMYGVPILWIVLTSFKSPSDVFNTQASIVFRPVTTAYVEAFDGAVHDDKTLPPALVDELHLRGVELWNMYGPTETTIWSTCGRLDAGDRVTLGNPLRNTTLYVLNEGLSVQPAGVAGEGYIRGPGLAPGRLVLSGAPGLGVEPA